MNPRLRALLGVTAAATLALGIGVVSAPSASATTPPWETDPSVPTLTFYNAAGAVVHSGSVADAPFATYVAASTVLRAGDTKATLFGYLPKNGVAVGGWSGEALSASTTFPSSPSGSVPSGVPVVTLTGGDLLLSDLVADFPNTATDSYQGLYQLRVKSSGSPAGGASATYAVADILVSGTTWTQVFPSVTTPTTTDLEVTPTSPVAPGTSVTLTSTSTTGVAGSVTFLDGATTLTSGVVVDTATGQASYTFVPTPGGHSYTAVLTPTDASTSPSTSAAQSFTVSPATATATLSAPAITRYGQAVSATVTVTGAYGTATGTVQVREGATVLASGTLSGGTAVVALPRTLAVRAHSLVAAYAGTATYAAATSTGRTLAVVKATSAVKLTLAPAAVRHTARSKATVVVTAPGTVPTGSVVVYDGTRRIGTGKLVRGRVTVTLPALAKGKHRIAVAYLGSSTVLSRRSAVVVLTST